jgi:two-component system chemotaxis sensor kinase CheA
VRDIFDFVGEDCPIAIGPGVVMPPVQIDTAMAFVPTPPTPTGPPVSAETPAPVEASAPAPSASGNAPPAPAAGQSIRIDLIKLDKLIDTVGELVIAQAMLVQRLQNDNIGASEELPCWKA